LLSAVCSWTPPKKMNQFWRDTAGQLKHKGLQPLFFSLAAACVSASSYFVYLGTRGPEVSYRRTTNPDPWVNYPTSRQQKILNPTDTRGMPRPAPAESYEAIGQKIWVLTCDWSIHVWDWPTCCVIGGLIWVIMMCRFYIVLPININVMVNKDCCNDKISFNNGWCLDKFKCRV